MSSRSLTITLRAEGPDLAAAVVRLQAAVDRLWSDLRRPDPNPFPHFHLFRRSPQP